MSVSTVRQRQRKQNSDPASVQLTYLPGKAMSAVTEATLFHVAVRYPSSVLQENRGPLLNKQASVVTTLPVREVGGCRSPVTQSVCSNNS